VVDEGKRHGRKRRISQPASPPWPSSLTA
jgi:hypothetical protein